MRRDIVHIDDALCNGCGQCIPNCPEGALQLIDGKARLVSDLFCDGLGACIGECPVGAITVEQREAQPYDERRVMENMIARAEAAPSRLRQWPVQLHLIPPSAPYFRDADVLLAADCTAYAHGDFHGQFLEGRRLAIACPKLDSNQDIYLDKIKALIDFTGIRSLTVLTMEVPCCRGLLQLARRAAAESERQIPIQWLEIGVQGDVLKQEALG
jgi:ferredoxin